MLSLRPLDPACPIQNQLQAASTPVVLVNLFTVPEGDVPSLTAAWEKDANWMKHDADFEALRPRTDFKQLLAELEAKTK